MRSESEWDMLSEPQRRALALIADTPRGRAVRSNRTGVLAAGVHISSRAAASLNRLGYVSVVESEVVITDLGRRVSRSALQPDNHNPTRS